MTNHREVEISETIRYLNENEADSITIVNLQHLNRCYKRYKDLLPQVDVHYAVKCFPHKEIIRRMIDLGSGFDCASVGELDLALECGADPSKIIFANPQKLPQWISHAHASGVNLFTFDSENELIKMLQNKGQHHAEYVLRLLPPLSDGAVFPLGCKYGATMQQAKRILHLCKEIKEKKLYENFEIVGLAFHVGMGCTNPGSYTKSIQMAADVVRYSKQLGFKFNLLDIGGGFMSESTQQTYNPSLCSPVCKFEDVCCAINSQLEQEADTFNNFSIISEPGTYFGGDVATLGARVVGRDLNFDVSTTDDYLKSEDQMIRDGKISSVKYYLTEGSFSHLCVLLFCSAYYPKFNIFRDGKQLANNQLFHSQVFGPTCASVDIIYKDIELPLLQDGDVIVMSSIGAYCTCAATSFNGIKPGSIVIIDK